jgi:hypothetical protein
MRVPYKDIPTYDYKTNEWSKTSFESQEEFSHYLDSLFKEPGKYEFDESTIKWNAEGRRFMKNKRQYCKFLRKTKEYIEYWDTQKDRCRKGVIYKNGDKEWYVTREFYMLLNFLPILNKEKNNRETFCDVRDVQYHIALYEKRAECQHKHGVVTKKRQMMSSFYHAAKMINIYWFEKKAILRNLAGDEAYLTGEKGIWNYYNGYRDFLNENTAWYRNNSPNSDLKWIQRIETFINGKRNFSGRKSIMTGTTFKRSATAGVGGPAYYNYFEEAGTFPKLDKTYLFMRPQLESGAITTGFFVAAGSVGELKDCQALKKFMESPEEYGFLGTENTWMDADRIPKITGLYIPEQWGMPPFIDKFGNSLVEEALDYLNKDYANKEKEMEAADYQLHISQHPRYMKEAFAYREVSRWPIRRIEKRQEYLKEDKYQGTIRVELSEDEKGNVKWNLTDKEDIPYPVDKKAVDKSGVVLIRELPDPRCKYYGGVDTIDTGTTTTSESLFSFYILKGVTEIEYEEEDGKKRTRTEGIKIVASWTGRLDSVEGTNDYGIMLMKMYGAKTLVERNKENFINRCTSRGIANKYLVRENEIPFNKEMDFAKDFTSSEYGMYMDSTGKKQERCDNYSIEYLNEELDAVYKKDDKGNQTEEKLKVYYGIEKIFDYWLLEEFKYTGKENTDRSRAFSLAMVMAKTYEIQGFKSRIRETKNTKPKERPKPRVRSLIGGGIPQRNTQNKKQRRVSLLGR